MFFQTYLLLPTLNNYLDMESFSELTCISCIVERHIKLEWIIAIDTVL